MQEIRTVMEEAHAVTRWNKGDRKALQRTSALRVGTQNYSRVIFVIAAGLLSIL